MTNQISLEAVLDIAGVTLEEFVELLRKEPNYKVLSRFVEREVLTPGEPTNPGIGIVLDTETTSKEAAEARIIELGMVKFLFDQDTGVVYRVLARFNKLKDPGIPIPPEATEVNNITDDMVRGQSITDEEVTDFVQEVDLVIAHNANFDRKVAEREFPIFEGKAWACTLKQVPWQAEGIAGAKLEYIASHFGFFYEAHRAEVDCLATLECMSKRLPTSGDVVMGVLLREYRSPGFKVYALDSPFETKDLLKKRGYRWHAGEPGQEKAWGLEAPSQEALEEEVKWLRQNIYRNRQFRLRVDHIDAFNRFSDRRNPQPIAFF